MKLFCTVWSSWWQEGQTGKFVYRCKISGAVHTARRPGEVLFYTSTWSSCLLLTAFLAFSPGCSLITDTEFILSKQPLLRILGKSWFLLHQSI